MPSAEFLPPDCVFLPVRDENGNGWWLLVGEGKSNGGTPEVDFGAIWQPLLFGATRPNPQDNREALDVPGTSTAPGNFGQFADLNLWSVFYWARAAAWRKLGFTTGEQPIRPSWFPGGAVGDALLPAAFDAGQDPLPFDALGARALLPESYGVVDYGGTGYLSPRHAIWLHTESSGFAGSTAALCDAETRIPAEANVPLARLVARCPTIYNIPIKCVPFPGADFDGSYFAVGDCWSRIAVLVSRNWRKWPSSTWPVAPGRIKSQWDEQRTVEIVRGSFSAAGGVVTGILTWDFSNVVKGLVEACNGPVLQQLRQAETSWAELAAKARKTSQAAAVKLVELAIHGPDKPLAVPAGNLEAPNVWMSAPGALGVEPGAVWIWGEWRDGGVTSIRWVKVTGLDGSPRQVELVGGQLRYRGRPSWAAGGTSFSDIAPAWVTGIPGGPFEGVRYPDRNKPRAGVSPLVWAAVAAGLLFL